MNLLKDFELCGKKEKAPFISVIQQGFIIGEETRWLTGDELLPTRERVAG